MRAKAFRAKEQDHEMWAPRALSNIKKKIRMNVNLTTNATYMSPVISV